MADKLVRIVEKYLPKQAEETRIHIGRLPHHVNGYVDSSTAGKDGKAPVQVNPPPPPRCEEGGTDPPSEGAALEPKWLPFLSTGLWVREVLSLLPHRQDKGRSPPPHASRVKSNRMRQAD